MATALATPYDRLGSAADLDAPLATVHHLRPAPLPVVSRGTYLRRRIGVAMVVALALLGLTLTVATEGTAATDVTVTTPALVPIVDTVILEPGMTLWEVAVDATAPGADPRVMLESIRQLNGFSGNLIPAWTPVAIPGA